MLRNIWLEIKTKLREKGGFTSTENKFPEVMQSKYYDVCEWFTSNSRENWEGEII